MTGADHHDVLDAFGVPGGLLQGRRGLRVAAGGLDPPSHDKGQDRVHPEQGRRGERLVGVGQRRRPVAALEPEPRPATEHVDVVAVQVVVGGEAQRPLHPGHRDRAVLTQLVRCHQGHVRDRAARVLDVALGRCLLVQQLQLADRGVGVLVQRGDPGRHPRVQAGLGVADAVRELPGPGRPLRRLVDQVGGDRQLGPVAVGHRELAAGRRRLEHLEGVVRRGPRLAALAGPPENPGDPAQVLTDQLGLAQLLPDGQGCLASAQRHLVPAGQVRREGVLLVEVRPVRLGQPIGVRRRGAVVRDGLPVRALADGAGPGDLAVAQHGVGVAGQPGVVHQQPRVAAGILGERLQDLRMQLGPARR